MIRVWTTYMLFNTTLYILLPRLGIKVDPAPCDADDPQAFAMLLFVTPVNS
jgi:hypothetical protein